MIRRVVTTCRDAGLIREPGLRKVFENAVMATERSVALWRRKVPEVPRVPEVPEVPGVHAANKRLRVLRVLCVDRRQRAIVQTTITAEHGGHAETELNEDELLAWEQILVKGRARCCGSVLPLRFRQRRQI